MMRMVKERAPGGGVGWGAMPRGRASEVLGAEALPSCVDHTPRAERASRHRGLAKSQHQSA